MSKIFQLTWGTYDGSTDHFFSGPPETTETEFKQLCDRLMREAAEDAVNGKCRCEWRNDRKDFWIGYDMLVDDVALRLKDHGYEKVQLPSAEYIHGMIIRVPEDDGNGVLGPDLTAKVIQHNKNLEDSYRTARQTLKTGV